MEGPRNLVVLLEPRAASQNLWQPEGANCALHVSNLALARCRRLDPLRWLPSHTAYHVCVGQRLGTLCSLSHVQRRGKRLGDSRMKGRGTAWDDQTVVPMVPGRRAVAVACPWTKAERRCHCGRIAVYAVGLAVQIGNWCICGTRRGLGELL